MVPLIPMMEAESEAESERHLDFCSEIDIELWNTYDQGPFHEVQYTQERSNDNRNLGGSFISLEKFMYGHTPRCTYKFPDPELYLVVAVTWNIFF